MRMRGLHAVAYTLFDMRLGPAERRRALLGTTAQDVRRAARAAFDPSHANLVLVGDADEATRREMAALLRRFRARLEAVARTRVPPPAPTTRRSPPTPRSRGGVLDLPGAVS
jgi:predicted Zn-dependent peptidase